MNFIVQSFHLRISLNADDYDFWFDIQNCWKKNCVFNSTDVKVICKSVFYDYIEHLTQSSRKLSVSVSKDEENQKKTSKEINFIEIYHAHEGNGNSQTNLLKDLDKT